jgi:putative transposase
MERFFSCPKAERIRGEIYRTRDAARADEFDHIECVLSTVCRRPTTGDLGPVQVQK